MMLQCESLQGHGLEGHEEDSQTQDQHQCPMEEQAR